MLMLWIEPSAFISFGIILASFGRTALLDNIVRMEGLKLQERKLLKYQKNIE